ncbi:MAG: histidine phosphatase family protein [Candidatus Marsarchaeota archaeon]|nr:histidine phosphatase family protein [Candidatus Marsarchaeota archaeon]
MVSIHKPIKLIIIRHGETYLNARGIHQGQLGGSLNAKGKRQAQRLALVLRKEKIHAIYSSDLRRAVQTTRIIARYHVVPIIYTSDLRERHMGVFQGRPWSETAEMRASGKDFTPEGGESDADQARRTRHFIARIRCNKTLEGKTVLISAHAGTVWMITSLFTKTPLHNIKRLKARNTGMLVFEISRRKNRLVSDEMFEGIFDGSKRDKTGTQRKPKKA